MLPFMANRNLSSTRFCVSDAGVRQTRLHRVHRRERHLGQFLSDEYDVTNVDKDKIPLSDVWYALRESRLYFNQIGLRMSRELSQKLKNKEFRVGLIRGKPTSAASSLKTAPASEDEDVYLRRWWGLWWGMWWVLWWG